MKWKCIVIRTCAASAMTRCGIATYGWWNMSWHVKLVFVTSTTAEYITQHHIYCNAWTMKKLDKLEEMQRSTVRQKDVSETEGEGIQNSDQASNAIWGRNVGYSEETIQTYWGDRDEDATMDVRSDTQRQDQEWTHPRNNNSGAGFQKDHREKIELVRACDEERWQKHTEESVEGGYTREKEVRTTENKMERRMSTIFEKYWTESGWGDGQGDVEKKDYQSYRRPYMMGKARGKVRRWRYHRPGGTEILPFSSNDRFRMLLRWWESTSRQRQSAVDNSSRAINCESGLQRSGVRDSALLRHGRWLRQIGGIHDGRSRCH